MDTIPSWSFSALSTYETCPYQAKLKKVDKVEELPRGTPPSGMLEWPHERGTRVHDNAEMYVRGEVAEPCTELCHFVDELSHLKGLYDAEMVEMEDMWCFTKDWCVTDEDADDVWLRVKLDAIVFDGEYAVVIDHKTGKKMGNEVKHAQQGQLYALATFIRYPELQKVDVEFWYLDQDDIYSKYYTRRAGLTFWPGWNERGTKMTSDTRFEPQPNEWNCRFCPYGPEESSNKWVKKNGHCKNGV